MKNILVIGGTGFIGSHLVERLCRDGYKVAVLARRGSDTTFVKSLGNIELRIGDILKPESLNDAFYGIDTVFCLVNVRPQPNIDYEKEVNLLYIEGTKNIINACKANSVKRIVYFSSVATIGYKKGISVYDQSSETMPVDAYGKAKLAAERILSESINRKELDVTIVRPVGIFGERGPGPLRKVIFFVEKGAVPILGSGNNRQSISYAGNIAEEAIFLALRNDTIGKTYILSDETSYTVNELIDTVASTLGKRPLKIHIPLWIVRFGVACVNSISRIFFNQKLINIENIIAIITERIFDASWLFRELGYRQKYSLAEAVKLTINWYKIEKCRKKQMRC